MTKDNEQNAYFTVSGDFDPEVITQQLGMRPSESWRKGDLNKRTNYERKSSRWSLNSRLDHSADLEEHVHDVLNQIRNHAATIRSMGEDFNCWIQLVGYFHRYYPGFTLNPELVADMALLNLGLDCDFYYLYSHEREDSK